MQDSTLYESARQSGQSTSRKLIESIPSCNSPANATTPPPTNIPPDTRSVLSKSALLTEFVSDKDKCEQIGSAWRLYFRLVLVEGGHMVGTYDQIGEVIGEKGNTIRNWVATMRTNEIITCKSVSKQVEIALTPDHMRIAQATDRVVEVMQAEHVETPRMQAIRRIVEAVEQGQGTIEFNVKL